MRFFKLVYRQYTTTLIRELVIMLLAGYLVLALTTVLSPFSNMVSLIREFKTWLPYETILFNPYIRVTGIKIGDIGNPAEAGKEMEENLEKALQSIDGLMGIGKCVLYNEDMLRYTRLPLRESTWFTEATASDGAIPILVGGDLAEEYAIGEVFEIDYNGRYVGSMRCEVIGKLNTADAYITLYKSTSHPTIAALTDIKSVDSKLFAKS